MSEYVPTTSEVETGFSEFATELNRSSPLEYPEATPSTNFTEAFYRWLADHYAEVRADAWDDGWAAGQTDPECNADNPYRTPLNGPTS